MWEASHVGRGEARERGGRRQATSGDAAPSCARCGRASLQPKLYSTHARRLVPRSGTNRGDQSDSSAGGEPEECGKPSRTGWRAGGMERRQRIFCGRLPPLEGHNPCPGGAAAAGDRMTNRHRCFGLRKQHRRGGDAFGAARGTRRPAGSKRTHAGAQREEFGAFRATRAQLDAAAGAAGSAGRPAAGADHPGKNTNESAEGRGTNAEARRQLQAWAGQGPLSTKGDVQQQVWFGFFVQADERASAGTRRGGDATAYTRGRASAHLCPTGM